MGFVVSPAPSAQRLERHPDGPLPHFGGVRLAFGQSPSVQRSVPGIDQLLTPSFVLHLRWQETFVSLNTHR